MARAFVCLRSWRAALGLAVLIAGLAPPHAFAQPPAVSTLPPGVPRVVPGDPHRLDALFARLAKAQDEDEANGIVRLIERRWMQSGSDTADLLMSRAVVAFATGNQPLAIEILDRVIALRPTWAEAWNKRASVFYAMGDYVRAVADIRQTLALEPRHFGAWAGLGMIFKNMDDDRHALAAFRHALAINPYASGLKPLVEQLAPGVDGIDL